MVTCRSAAQGAGRVSSSAFLSLVLCCASERRLNRVFLALCMAEESESVVRLNYEIRRN